MSTLTHPHPIYLTSSQLDAVMLAARPLTRAERSAFLEEIAAALQRIPGGELGDGQVYLIIKQLQRAHFRPPDMTRNHSGKHA